MQFITLLEFRKNAKKIIESARRGKRMIVTYRGKPVCRLEPIGEEAPEENDRFYQLDQIASEKGSTLNNSRIDKIVYGL